MNIKKIAKIGALGIVGIGLCGFYRQVQPIYSDLMEQIASINAEKVQPVEIQIHNVPVPGESFKRKLKEKSQEMGINPIIPFAIAEHETRGIADWTQKMRASRFEPDRYSALKNKRGRENDGYLRQLSTSHCAMQVMGETAESYGIHYSELYNEDKCIEAGLKKIQECDKRSNGEKSYLRRVWLTFKCFNGTGERAEQYADVTTDYVSENLMRHFIYEREK